MVQSGEPADELAEVAPSIEPSPPEGASVPQHLASAPALEQLRERVNLQYGAFGERTSDRALLDEPHVGSDSSWKATAELIGGVAAASLFLSFVSSPAFSGQGAWASTFRLDTVFVLVWGPLLVRTILRQRLWKSLRVYLVLALFIEAFSEVMFKEMGEGGYWDSFLWPASVAYFGTLKEFSGLPGASLPVFFFVTVGLLARGVWGKKPASFRPPPNVARTVLLLFLGTVLLLAVIGLARGGQVEWTFRQVVHLMQLPLVGLLFLYVLRVPEDLASVGTAFVVTAVVRSLLVAWVYFGVCVPQGITSLPGKPEWCTNHSDSVLFVSALVILFAHALEQRRKKVTLRCLGLGAAIFVAIVLNNRRLAFVSLAIAPLVIYLALVPSKRKRRVTVALALVVPLIAGYVFVGSETDSSSALFKPAKNIVSVLDQKDTSSLSRDIENENLIYTLTRSSILSRGFGHEYEYSPNHPPVDLSDVFENYRLIAHNGVLWLWSIAGVVGFTLLWLVYPIAGTLAVRGYRSATSSVERTAALSCLGGVVVCVMQIWGDQGLNSYMTLVTFGVCFAVASRLAMHSTRMG